MFDSLNEQIRRNERSSETSKSRLLRYGGTFFFSLFAFWALYMGIRYLE
jgi:hypothetical protein